MLHINDLTYRIEGKLILDAATAAIPEGHKVGLVGRNGAGKTTLLKLLKGELHADDGGITTPKTARIGHVAQEAPGGEESLIDWVLSADQERAQLMAESEHASKLRHHIEAHNESEHCDQLVVRSCHRLLYIFGDAVRQAYRRSTLDDVFAEADHANYNLDR